MKGFGAQSKGANSLGGEGVGEDTLWLGVMFKIHQRNHLVLTCTYHFFFKEAAWVILRAISY